MLVEYVKNKQGHRVGVVVAISKDRIGWSRCKTKPSRPRPNNLRLPNGGFDTFDKEMALKIAIGRAKTMRRTIYLSERLDSTGKPFPLNTPIPKTIPPRDVQKVIEHVEARAKAYFKTIRMDSGRVDVVAQSLDKSPAPLSMRDILASARKVQGVS